MLIGLHGKKQAGKDTVHRRIEALYGPASMAGATVERLSFADLLYESAAEALGVFPGDLAHWKADDLVTVRVTRYDPALAANVDLTRALTIREYLQRYGTEAHRRIFGDNFWVDQVAARLREHARKVVVVTDVRFPNEAEAIFNAGGSVVWVVGPKMVEEAGDSHASERLLPKHLITHTLFNTARTDHFRDLDSQVRELVSRLLRTERRERGVGDPVYRP